MKNILFGSILMFCLTLSGCQNKAREAFLAEHTEATNEIVRIIDANPNSKGVEEAKKYLQAKKTSLRKNFEDGKGGSNFGSSSQDNFLETITANFQKLTDLKERNKSKLSYTETWDLESLIKDFQTFLLKK